jgi:hypothetical protein
MFQTRLTIGHDDLDARLWLNHNQPAVGPLVIGVQSLQEKFEIGSNSALLTVRGYCLAPLSMDNQRFGNQAA